MNAHPLDPKLATFPLDAGDQNSWRSIGERAKQEVIDSFAALEALQPGDPTVEGAITRCSTALVTLTVGVGAIRGWTIARQRELYEHGKRLLGVQQRFVPPPSTSEF